MLITPAGMAPGQLRNKWQNTLNANTTLPRPAISGIRLYERFFTSLRLLYDYFAS